MNPESGLQSSRGYLSVLGGVAVEMNVTVFLPFSSTSISGGEGEDPSDGWGTGWWGPVGLDRTLNEDPRHGRERSDKDGGRRSPVPVDLPHPNGPQSPQPPLLSLLSLYPETQRSASGTPGGDVGSVSHPTPTGLQTQRPHSSTFHSRTDRPWRKIGFFRTLVVSA